MHDPSNWNNNKYTPAAVLFIDVLLGALEQGSAGRVQPAQVELQCFDWAEGVAGNFQDDASFFIVPLRKHQIVLLTH